MKRISKTILFTSATILLALSVFPVAAQVIPLGANVDCTPGNPCGGGETVGVLRFYLLVSIAIVLSIFWLLAAIFLIYAAFRYITSRGDIENAAAAKRQIVYAILGLILASLSLVIADAVINLDTSTLVPRIVTIVDIGLSLIGLLAAIFIIYGGVVYISSTGDEEKARQAKSTVLYAIIGLILAGLAYIISTNLDPVGPLDVAPIGTRITNIVNVVLGLVAIITAIYIVVAGVMYVSSTGDSDKAQRAKQQVIYAVIGLIIIGFAAAIVNFIVIAVS